jgi:hypothetical protein
MPNSNSKSPNCNVWGWYYPVTRLEGIDGRPLDTQSSACNRGGCSFVDDDDGFIYAFLAPSAVHAIQRHTLVGARVQPPGCHSRPVLSELYLHTYNIQHT